VRKSKKRSHSACSREDEKLFADLAKLSPQNLRTVVEMTAKKLGLQIFWNAHGDSPSFMEVGGRKFRVLQGRSGSPQIIEIESD
jgi:hypothetical protein